MKEEPDEFLTKFKSTIKELAVQPSEMAESIQSLLGIIADLEKRLDASLEEKHGESTRDTQSLRDELSSIQAKVEQLGYVLSNTENKLTEDHEQRVVQVIHEIERIEKSIPVMPEIPSFDPILEKIAQVENKIPVLKEIKPEEVRDKLESLKDDERLDASAIKNLPKPTREVVSGGGGLTIGGGSSGIKGVAAGTNIIVDSNPYTPMVTLNITASVAPPANPVFGELWISL